MGQNFDDVLEILKKEGLSDEKIAEFLLTLNNALSEQLYTLIAQQLSEQDMQKLNTITDDGQRETQMQQIFEQKTNQNLKDISDQFVKSFTREFLEGYSQL